MLLRVAMPTPADAAAAHHIISSHPDVLERLLNERLILCEVPAIPCVFQPTNTPLNCVARLERERLIDMVEALKA